MPKEPSEQPATQVTPDPKLEKRIRRTFKPDYKLKIIEPAAACEHGELGHLLRRENLYSNQLAEWRRDYPQNRLAGLDKSTLGPVGHQVLRTATDRKA